MSARAASTALALVLGGTACSAAVPPHAAPTGAASPSGVAETARVGTPAAAPSSAGPASRPTPPKPPRVRLALDVRSIDASWTDPLLAFASDGESIIYSSGVADGPNAQAAPDLWRYFPGADEPELLWSNPRRDRSLVLVRGDIGKWVFVEMPMDGTPAWDLWLLTESGGEPIHLDAHPGDEDVSSLVPSVAVGEDEVAWTAFDRGADGPVSQLLVARSPGWEPQVVTERPAREAELWFPSLRGPVIAYGEVRYSADRSSDERHVYLLDRSEPSSEARRLDTSGLATMPVLVENGVVWKETTRGLNMFSWGRLVHHDLRTAETKTLSMLPQRHLNYPSAGRFVVAWGADAFTFTVHDLELGATHTLERYAPETHQSVLRPHVAWDLLVWLYTNEGVPEDEEVGELRYAFLPAAGTDRRR